MHPRGPVLFRVLRPFFLFRLNNASLTRIRERRGRPREGHKNNRFNKQNNNFARASHFFVHFFPVFARLRAVKMPYFAFIEDVNKQQRNFISLSEFGSVVI